MAVLIDAELAVERRARPVKVRRRGHPAGRELREELLDEAVHRARLRQAVGELDDETRERPVDELLAQLQHERDPLSDELRERLLDGMLGELCRGPPRRARDPRARRAAGRELVASRKERNREGKPSDSDDRE